MTGQHEFLSFRFTPKSCRNENADSVQLSQIQFRLAGGEVLSMRNAMVKNPRGLNPEGHNPRYAIDNKADTSWIDFNKGPLVVTFPAVVSVNAFRFITASDSPDRDPVSWILEAAVDHSSDDWKTLHVQETRYGTPEGRKKATMWFQWDIQDGEPVPRRVRTSVNMHQTSQWLSSLHVADLIAAKLENEVGGISSPAFQNLAKQSDKAGFVLALTKSKLIDDLAELLHDGARSLALAGGVAGSPAHGRSGVVETASQNVKMEAISFLQRWQDEEALLQKSTLITGTLLSSLEEKLAEITKGPDAWQTDRGLRDTFSGVLAAKQWVTGGGAIRSAMDLFKLVVYYDTTLSNFTGQRMWVQESSLALEQAFGSVGLDSALFDLEMMCTGKNVEVVALEPQLNAAWCSVPEVTEEDIRSSGIYAALKEAEALKTDCPEIFAEVVQALKAQSGVDLSPFLDEMRRRLHDQHLILPLSALVPQEDVFEDAVADMPEADKEACLRLIVARFLHSDVATESVLRYFLLLAIRSLAGGREEFVKRLLEDGGEIAIWQALPKGLIHQQIVLGEVTREEDRITVEFMKSSGFKPEQARALGFSGSELAACWTSAELEERGYLPPQIRALFR